MKIDFKKKATDLWAIDGCTRSDIEKALKEAYNEGVEVSASLAERSYVEHDGYAYLLETKIRELKEKIDGKVQA